MPPAAHDPPDFRPLDWHRMFMGDETPLFLVEIALRTSIIFVFTLVLLRLIGKRGVAQHSLFEVTIIVGLGAAVGDPMFQADVPLVHSMVVLTVIVVLYRGFLSMLRRSELFERFVEGTPTCLVTDGRVDREALKKERLSNEELYEVLRASGITQLGEVKRAYIEQSGKISVFAFPPQEIEPGLPIVPPWDLIPEDALHSGEESVEPGFYACRCCGEVIRPSVTRALPRCERCRAGEWLVAKAKPLGIATVGV